MITDALKGAGRPVSAYEIIDSLRETAVLAPQTVYRALDRLIAAGAVHRLESLNAFVACSHADHAAPHTGTAIFAICETCGAVSEFDSAEAVAALSGWAKKHRFAVGQMTLELRGTCAGCERRR